MEDNNKYLALKNLINNVDKNFLDFRGNILNIFKLFKEGFANYLGCEQYIIKNVNPDEFSNDYDFNKTSNTFTVSYDSKTGVFSSIILIKLDTMSIPTVLSFRLEIKKYFKEKEYYDISIAYPQTKIILYDFKHYSNFNPLYDSIYNHFYESYQGTLENNFINYNKKKLEKLGF
jgi:hypothetical protein